MSYPNEPEWAGVDARDRADMFPPSPCQNHGYFRPVRPHTVVAIPTTTESEQAS